MGDARSVLPFYAQCKFYFYFFAAISSNGIAISQHNELGNINQEFYLWPTVTKAAQNAIDMRYRLLDYFYTAFHQQHIEGTPVVSPLWFKYPSDPNTFPIDLQFLFGDSILVSPVTQENATSVTIYLPNDIFYDFLTFQPVHGAGSNITLDNVNFTSIPVHIRGGVVLPLRIEGAMTTKALRSNDFELIVAPGLDGTATGSLYVDDGVSISPASSTTVTMNFSDAKLTVNGTFDYATGVKVAQVRFLNVAKAPRQVTVDDKVVALSSFNYGNKILQVNLGFQFSQSFSVSYVV